MSRSWRWLHSWLFGIGTAFESRNNDIDGYWALGKLCLFAQQSHVDCLPVILQTTDSDLVTVEAGPFRLQHMEATLRKLPKNIPLSDLTLSVYFDFSQAIAAKSTLVEGQIRISLSHPTKTIDVQIPFLCQPHDPIVETRSSRVP